MDTYQEALHKKETIEAKLAVLQMQQEEEYTEEREVSVLSLINEYILVLEILGN